MPKVSKEEKTAFDKLTEKQQAFYDGYDKGWSEAEKKWMEILMGDPDKKKYVEQRKRISELEFALAQIAEAVKQGQYFKVAGMVRKALEGDQDE